MSRAEKFPAPIGPIPLVSDTTVDTSTAEGLADYRVKSAQARAYNEYVRANRRHRVAVAVDTLEAAEALSPADTISLILGVSYLEEQESGPLPFPFSLLG